MKRTLIINDLHLGVQRSGGTTIQSAAALRRWAHEQHRALLMEARFRRVERLVYNGDLTDTFDIELGDAIEIFADTRQFMMENPDIEVVWGEGNHDLSKDSSRMGTVAFIGRVLEATFPGRFLLVEQPRVLDDGLYLIPHLANQTLFDAALAAVPEGTRYLLLHCNYDNTFAGQQDHSLNISRDQAKELTRRGITVILGHEHQGRELMGGKVVIAGNQFPTSIADCLRHGDAQKDGRKYCLLLDASGEITKLKTWDPEQEPTGWYAEVDWHDLKDTTEAGRGFIRVTGTASGLEAANVIKEISYLRQRSASFVITNAVKVEKPEGFDDLPDAIEDIQQVNVMELLYGMLEPEQVAKLKELRGEA
jgi:DNA repair exonuclease SbcCD nuclease subunit